MDFLESLGAMSLIDSEFSRIEFDRNQDKEALQSRCERLAEQLYKQLLAGGLPFLLVEDLRRLGHDLWSFDEDGEGMGMYCGDWSGSRKRTGGELVLEFEASRFVYVSWKVGDTLVESSRGMRRVTD